MQVELGEIERNQQEGLFAPLGSLAIRSRDVLFHVAARFIERLGKQGYILVRTLDAVERCFGLIAHSIAFPTARHRCGLKISGSPILAQKCSGARMECGALTLAKIVNQRTLRAVIVDDEELARAYLRELLRAHPEIEIAAECANGFEAVKAISEMQPDLAFLDIQMPKLDGFEVLELIERGQGAGPAVVFVTAYDQHAMRAFDAHAVDYLLKPFGAERFEKALERAKARLGEPSPLAGLAREARAPEDRPRRIVVRDGTRVHVIPLEKLDYAEAQDDYVALHSGGKSYLKQQPIGDLEAALDPARFVRIHRSAIVNLERVTRVEPYGKESRIAILEDGKRLPVSRSGYARLLVAMGDSAGKRSETR